MLERSAVHRKLHRQILHNLLLRHLAVLIDVLIHTFLINLFNVIVVILFSFTQNVLSFTAPSH